MNKCRVIPICMTLTLATAMSAAGQDTRSTGPGAQHGGEHGPAGFFGELHQWGYSEDEMATIQAHVETIHQSIEEILGLHGPEASAGDTEEAHRAGESALMRFHESYESVVAELEEEHGRAFTAMLFEHLLHALPAHGHGGEGHSSIGGQHGHGKFS